MRSIGCLIWSRRPWRRNDCRCAQSHVGVSSPFWRRFSASGREAVRAGVEVDLTVRYEQYRATCPPDTRTIVFRAKAKLSDQWVDDRYVAGYVAKHPDTLIGFLCVDPTRDGWEREMHKATRSLACAGSNCCRCMRVSAPTKSGSIRFGNMRASINCRYCCTRARRSSAGSA